MSTVLSLPNGEVLFTILAIGVLSLMLTSVGALLGIWTWKTPQSILVLVAGVVLIFFVANYVLVGTVLG
jgi:putative Mn2+ efflux pump MntP